MASRDKEIDWTQALKRVIEKYKNAEPSLNYHSIYELMVMVILAAQTSDDLINTVTPSFFKKFPTMQKLSKASKEDVLPLLSKVRNFHRKTDWLLEIAKSIKSEKNIPQTIAELVALKGVGRKSANVIMRGAGLPAEGIMCDLHVIRVANRVGLSAAKDGNKVEKQLMEKLPKDIWGTVGSALSSLGRDICRPTDPKHNECPLNSVCEYCMENNCRKSR